jgi:N-acetylneuraminic acid mutarotase
MADEDTSSIGPTGSWTGGKRREGIMRTGLRGILALVALIASLVVGSLSARVVHAATPTWTQLSPSGSLPAVRVNDTAVWDTADNQMLVFGGNNASAHYNDLWAYQPASTSWTQLSPSGSPPAARAAQCAVWDAADSQMLVFAGSNGMSTLNDLWAYRPASNSWTLLSPSGSLPPARFACTAVWDAADSQMLVFGGNSGVANGPIFNDLWAYRPASNSWTQLSPSGSPPHSRYYHAAVWDAADAQMLVFGGFTGGGIDLYLNDLWAYQPASNSWTQLSPSGSPPSPGRYYPTAAWDAADSQMLIFGGYNAGTLFNDLWAYQPASNSWTQLSPSGSPPSPRLGPTSVWDAADSQMLVFGGTDNGSVFYNDLWSFHTPTLPPTIMITMPASGATYLLNQSVAASYACAPGSASIATCAGPVASGAPIDTGSVGTKSFTVQASDSSGNTSSQSVTYTVSYNLCLLYDPTQVYQSGSTIPIRLELCDASGADVSSTSISVTAVSVTQISTNVSDTPVASGNANPDNNFRFDATLGAAGGYIYNLSTKGLATGTYALSFTAGSDPPRHTVQFEVK